MTNDNDRIENVLGYGYMMALIFIRSLNNTLFALSKERQ